MHTDITSTTHLLYLHGFRSSPQSAKARQMAARVADLNAQRPGRITWWCPPLPPSPAEAMAVVGSSLGGFYATWVAERQGCKAVLLNPAVHPARDLVKHLGVQTSWHDPNETFTVHEGYLGELQALECGPVRHPEHYFSVIAQGDEVLDWREMTGRYPGTRIKLLEGSDHGLSDFEQHIDEVFAFLNLR